MPWFTDIAYCPFLQQYYHCGIILLHSRKTDENQVPFSRVPLVEKNVKLIGRYLGDSLETTAALEVCNTVYNRK